MRKHASEMTLEEIEAGEPTVTLWANRRDYYRDVARELKAHQAKQDAEIARLKAQLDVVLAVVDAEPPPRLNNGGLKAQRHMNGVVGEFRRNIKARILAAKGETRD